MDFHFDVLTFLQFEIRGNSVLCQENFGASLIGQYPLIHSNLSSGGPSKSGSQARKTLPYHPLYDMPISKTIVLSRARQAPRLHNGRCFVHVADGSEWFSKRMNLFSFVSICGRFDPAILFELR